MKLKIRKKKILTDKEDNKASIDIVHNPKMVQALNSTTHDLEV